MILTLQKNVTARENIKNHRHHHPADTVRKKNMTLTFRDRNTGRRGLTEESDRGLRGRIGIIKSLEGRGGGRKVLKFDRKKNRET